MIYLFFQTFLWIFLAGLLGLLIGWLIWGRETDSLREQLDQCRGSVQRLESSAAAASLSASMDQGTGVVDAAPGLSSTPTEPEDHPELFEVREDWKPESLERPDGNSDDLKRIKGIGPVIQKTLNELGIFHFHQIAEFSDDNIRWVDHHIAFPGRIRREMWVSQAADLAEGKNTDFSNRYDRRET